jgi:hypothetical protein
MKTTTPKAVLFVLVLSAFACGIANRFTGGDKMKAAAELWSDVPRMEGITKSDGEMPSWLRLVVRPVLSTMMRGVNDGKDPGVWDVVFYTVTGKTPKDVTDFYSPARMSNYGWERKGDANCMNLSGDGVVLCAFTKHAGDKDVGLVIIAALDEKEKQTSIFFMRNDTTPAPTPNR